jgi:central kinetochore subunit Mis15/CHL4
MVNTANMAHIEVSAPTKLRLPSSLGVSTANAAVNRILNRLSRSALITLALDWLDEGNTAVTRPFILGSGGNRGDQDGDDGAFADNFYPPAASVGELQSIYRDMQQRKGSKREVLDRILQGDWRHGLTLYQLAMADFHHLADHPTSQRWVAHRILPLKALDTTIAGDDVLRIDDKSMAVPRVHPSAFLEALQHHVLPDAKAHFQFDHRRSQPFVLLRIFVIDTPYNTELGLSGGRKSDPPSDFETSRTMFVAFPDGAPFIYLSRAQTLGSTTAADTNSLRDLIFTGVRRALSRPRQRYTVMPTALASRNLTALLHVRGRGRNNTAGGGWSVYASDDRLDTPLDLDVSRLPLHPVSRNTTAAVKPLTGGVKRQRHPPSGSQLPRRSKRAKLVATARFGQSGMVGDGKGFERVHVTLVDCHPAHQRHAAPSGSEEHDDDWTPSIRFGFQGSHVFAGVRQLVERGIIAGDRMPAWLSGEENVTTGTVRHGRMRGSKAVWL